MAYKVLDIANKLLLKAEDVCGGDLMSNLKLQKMLYYQQGYHLAAFGTPLFNEEIEAWMYGPAIPVAYNHYKSNGAGGIKGEGTAITLQDEEEELFNAVFDAYIEFSAYGLMRKTHEEYPWRTTERNQIITHDKLTEYFKDKIANE